MTRARSVVFQFHASMRVLAASISAFLICAALAGPSAGADLIPTSLSYSNGVFMSVVKNQGTAATPTGVAIGVAYSVDGNKVSCGWVNGPLAAGASVTIGAGCGTYTIPNGTHTITVLADDANRMAESDKTNNRLTQSITIPVPVPVPVPPPSGRVCSNGPTTFYVSASGNDGNPGTQAAPFKTVNRAASLAKPGTIIQVGAGSYPINAFAIYGGPSGTAAAHITLRGDPNATRGSIVFTGGQWSIGVNNGMQYWDICHLAQDGGMSSTGPSDKSCITDGHDSQGIAFVNVANVNVDDVEARNNCQAGLRAYGPQGQAGLLNTNINFTNSYIHDNCLRNWNNLGDNFDSGIVFQDVVNSTMSGNLVENNWGEGINTLASEFGPNYNFMMNNKMINNIIHNSVDTLIYNSSASGTLISGNFGYHDNPGMGNGQNEGIKMADEINTGLAGTGVVIMNNIIYGGWHGFRYGAYDTQKGFFNATLVGNTFVNSLAEDLLIDAGAPHSGNVIANNIFFGQHGGFATFGSSSGVTFGHNLWFGNTAGMVVGPGDVVADPKFTGGAYSSPAYYTLQSASSAKNTGMAVTGWTTDFAGLPRSNTPSRGAFE